MRADGGATVGHAALADTDPSCVLVVFSLADYDVDYASDGAAAVYRGLDAALDGYAAVCGEPRLASLLKRPPSWWHSASLPARPVATIGSGLPPTLQRTH